MFATLFKHVAMGLLVVRPDGTVAAANPAVAAMLGYDEAELVGMKVDALVPERLRSTHAEHRRAYQRDPTPRAVGGGRELLAVRKDGSEVPVEIGLFPAPRGGEVFVGLIDVSERVRTRRALDEAYAINRTGTWTYDLTSNAIYWSPKLFRILGVPEGSRVPPLHTHEELFSPESWARIQPLVARAIEHGESYQLEVELAARDHDDGPRFAIARCEPQTDGKGNVTRLFGTFQDATELLRAQRQRQQLLGRLSLAQSAAGVGIWEWDMQGEALLWDERMYALYGISERPATYAKWKACVLPDDLEAAEHYVQEVAAGRGDTRHTFRIRGPDGVRHILASASVHTDAASGRRRMIGVNMDVTESAHFQETLRKRDAHLGLVMQALPDAVFTLRLPEQRIEFVNEQVEHILGYTPEELIGRTTRVFYPTEDAFETVRAALEASFGRSEIRFQTEVALRTKDGRELHCEVTLTHDHEAANLVGAVCTIRSIEDRWQAQKRLRERQEQWDRFSAVTSNLLWNRNFADDVVERNIGFQTALGYEAEEVEPTVQWWSDRVHPDDRARVLARFEAAVEDGTEKFEYTYRFRCGDGHYLPFQDRVFIMRDDQGAPFRALGVMNDITDQLRHEEERMRANNLESLGLLAGGIAHDFNNLLSGVMTHAELIAVHADNPKRSRALAQQICAAVDNASKLTQQLLTFSKGGAPARRLVSLQDLLREQVTFSVRGSATQVEFDFEPGLFSADVDPGQIGQVIQNLALNAVQAMSKGGSLKLEARNLGAEDADGPFVELRISDTGPGMPPEVLKRVFDPYFSTKDDGHGLGLSICHSIIERHGGSLQVASVVGRGTTFTIRLPASTEVEAGASKTRRKAARGEGRVLLVDDLDDVRDALARLLRAIGYEVTATGTVDEAVAHFEDALRAQAGYDVVVTDLTIPGSEGGLEVVRRVKALEPSVKVVVVSGYVLDPVLTDPQEYGFDATLSKPVRMSEMSELLARLLAKREPVPHTG